MIVVGVDTGGTFTDLVVVRSGRARVVKVPSTREDPSDAILAGLEALGVRRAEIRHGSTVATNALLERRGARTAFVTNAGLRDVVEIGRQDRPSLYDLDVDRPPPLVPRALRLGLDQRTDRDGRSVRDPDPADLEPIARRLERGRVESVAVGLLFSFLDPSAEHAVRRALAGLGIPVSLSSEVSPEAREYERFQTTIANAYLAPVMQRYLERLRSRTPGTLRIMQSNGGLASARAASERPVHTVLSGPAAGVVGAARIAARAGIERAIPFDMGGTSTDVALVDGAPAHASEFVVGGCPLRVPVLDIHTVGAGGGSIAHRDEGGALRVGPQSAGADPGPACYGRGTEPTVTDAHVVLGRIAPRGLLGGDMELDRERAAEAVGRLARDLSLDLEETAEGIVRVALATMERAVKVISLERGHDPRDYTLVAFGGAGGLHAVELARQLGMPRVLVPPHPGALSALGLVMADAVRDRTRSVADATASSPGPLEPALEAIERAARRELVREGVSKGKIRVERSVRARYRGQAHELAIPFRRRGMPASFHRAHEARYGTAFPEREIEYTSVRVRAVGKLRRDVPAERPEGSGARAERARVFAGGRWSRAARIERAALAAGVRLQGPAIVTEYSSTLWLPPGSEATADDAGNLIVDPGAASPGRRSSRAELSSPR